MASRISELKTLLAEKPSAGEFLELARLLSKSKDTKAEARDVLFKGITHHPSNYVARLLLAKLFFEDGMYSFSARELAELWSINRSETIKKLLIAFGDHSKNYIELFEGKLADRSAVSTLAEIDLEGDFTDALTEIEDDSE